MPRHRCRHLIFSLLVPFQHRAKLFYAGMTALRQTYTNGCRTFRGFYYPVIVDYHCRAHACCRCGLAMLLMGLSARVVERAQNGLLLIPQLTKVLVTVVWRIWCGDELELPQY